MVKRIGEAYHFEQARRYQTQLDRLGIKSQLFGWATNQYSSPAGLENLVSEKDKLKKSLSNQRERINDKEIREKLSEIINYIEIICQFRYTECQATFTPKKYPTNPKSLK